jgi:hypothetical protein
VDRDGESAEQHRARIGQPREARLLRAEEAIDLGKGEGTVRLAPDMQLDRLQAC